MRTLVAIVALQSGLCTEHVKSCSVLRIYVDHVVLVAEGHILVFRVLPPTLFFWYHLLIQMRSLASLQRILNLLVNIWRLVPDLLKLRNLNAGLFHLLLLLALFEFEQLKVYLGTIVGVYLGLIKLLILVHNFLVCFQNFY